ncbi:MAG: DNA alkylation repair protein [Bacteroidota bacterium]
MPELLIHQLPDLLMDEIKERSDPEKAAWWNRYLKGEISFLGVGIPEIRKILLEMDRERPFGQLPMNRQVSLVNKLMRGDFAEEKMAAILYVQLFWLDRMDRSFILDLVNDWFDDRLIYDWNTTDWLCVRILTPLVDSGDPEVLWKLKRWNRDPYLWKARASLVAFAQATALTGHAKNIELFSDILIRRKERFAKTAVGWVMREYSKHDPEFVLTFLRKHVKHTTSEVKRNALKYYREEIRA